MIIDVHTHLGRNSSISARVDDLLKSMDRARIDHSLVFAGQIGGISNEEMLEEIRPHRDRLTGIIAATNLIRDPFNDLTMRNDLKRWEDMLRREDVAGIKFYTGYEHVYPSDDSVYAVMSRVQVAGKTAIFHCGDCLKSEHTRNAKLKYAHPLRIDDVATDFPNTRIVIAHMGNPWVRDAAEVCYKNSNVYVDISGFVYGQFTDWDRSVFMRAWDEFLMTNDNESDHILFGTDWPISDQSSYAKLIEERFVMDEFTDNALRAFTLNIK